MQSCVMRLLCIGVVACLLTACGYKTSPRPATATIPGEIAVVEPNAYPDRIVLKWIIPRSNTDGSTLADISGFKVFRTTHKAGEECEECRDKKPFHANVDFQRPVDAQVTKEEVIYTDKDVSPGNVYTYSVVTYNLQGTEGKAGPDVSVSLENAPAAPVDLRVEKRPSGVVEVLWRPATPEPDIRGYRVYRGLSDKPGVMKLLAGVRGYETSYTDKTPDKDKTYHYAVRSFRLNGNVPVESKATPAAVPSAEVKLSAPTDLSADPQRNGIHLTWETGGTEGEDLRFNVYRSESGRIYTKINSEPLTTPSFVDHHVRRNKTYKYGVTAFREGNAGEETARSAVVTVQYRR